MKKYIFITSLITLTLFFIVGYTSCSVDKCAGVTCQNGGTCSGGSCKCLSGYTGTNCEKRTCEANNTAQIRFQNKTGTSTTYSVVFDGSTITTVAPGATSDYFTVTAGIHTLHFMIANSTNEACTISTPNLVVCTYNEYYCTK
ncbi:MAG: calcium-binding EGF-like domain-containing protein [Bacteroidetes bacterium]|nr:calcium-binding EGF-like domain-containing protein [Bacteroidota bacterium]